MPVSPTTMPTKKPAARIEKNVTVMQVHQRLLRSADQSGHDHAQHGSDCAGCRLGGRLPAPVGVGHVVLRGRRRTPSPGRLDELASAQVRGARATVAANCPSVKTLRCSCGKSSRMCWRCDRLGGEHQVGAGRARPRSRCRLRKSSRRARRAAWPTMSGFIGWPSRAWVPALLKTTSADRRPGRGRSAPWRASGRCWRCTRTAPGAAQLMRAVAAGRWRKPASSSATSDVVQRVLDACGRWCRRGRPGPRAPRRARRCR